MRVCKNPCLLVAVVVVVVVSILLLLYNVNFTHNNNFISSMILLNLSMGLDLPVSV